jgi:hypothetical protein
MQKCVQNYMKLLSITNTYLKKKDLLLYQEQLCIFFTYRVFCFTLLLELCTFIGFEKSWAHYNSEICFTVLVFAIICPYVANFGSYLTTFRDGLSVSFSSVLQSKNSAANR